jgi:hypothetical protein
MQMPQSIKHTTQGLSTQSQPRSAQRSLVKVESGINGLLPTSWAPPIYSVSLLTKLRCALTGHCFLPLAAVRSFLARICQTQKTNQEVRKNHRGLDNVGFIGASPLCTASKARKPRRFAYILTPPRALNRLSKCLCARFASLEPSKAGRFAYSCLS